MLLYVHIPFCESKCPYCAFGSVVGKRNLTSAYFDAMIADFREQILKFDVSQGAQNRQRSGKTEASKQNSGEFDDTSEQTAKPNLTTKNAQISQNLNRKNIKNAAVNQKKAGLNLANPNLNTKECGKIVTVEEHNILGGLGEAVAAVTAEYAPVPVHRIGVRDVFGHSGPAAELLKQFGLTAEHIVEKTKVIVGK